MQYQKAEFGATALRRYIKQHEGLIVSEATLQPSHLLDAYIGVCERYHLRPKGLDDARKTFMVSKSAYSGKGRVPTEDLRDRETESLEMFDQYFNDICPRGYYFGANEGDGACIGFWKDYNL